MPRFLLFLLAYFPLSLLAQNSFSYVSPHKWDEYVAMDVTNDLFVAVGHGGECDYPKITALDPDNGTLRWELSPAGFSFGRYADVVFASDGTFWVSGWVQDSEDIWGNFRTLLTHLDQEGNILSHREQEVMEVSPETSSMLAILPDDRLFWNIGTEVHLVGTDGLTQGSWISTNESPYLQIAAVNPDFFVVATAFGVYRINADASVSTYYEEDETPRSLITSADQAWWFIGDQLQSFTYATQEHESLVVDTSLYSLPRIYFAENETITLYSTKEPPFEIGSLDTATGEITYLNSLPAVQRHLYQLQEQDGDYFLLGGDLFEGSVGYRRLVNGFVERIQQETMSPRPDIGVSNLFVTLDSFSLLQVGPESFKISCHFSGIAEVSNYADITVDQFFVSSQAFGGFNCVEGRFNEIFDITLAPEETVSVPFSYRAVTGVIVEPNGDFTAEHDICIFTGAPNRQLDMDPLNNTQCETLVLVNTEDQLIPSDKLLVFPNPAQNAVQVQQLGQYLERLELFDLTGRLVLSQKVEQYDQVQVNISSLATGQYILLVQTDQGVHRQQLSIQR